MAANTSAVEEAKWRAAQRAVDEHFSPHFNYVGIGSGTTILYVVEAIKRACEIASGGSSAAVDDSASAASVAVKAALQHRRRSSLDDPAHPLHHRIRFVPTGFQSREVIRRAGLTPVAFDSLPDDLVLDVAFDGADEVDDELNCIKGGGACLFQEKLVATRARKFVCVAGEKDSRLCVFCTVRSVVLACWHGVHCCRTAKLRCNVRDTNKTVFQTTAKRSRASSPNGRPSQLKWRQSQRSLC